MTNLFNMRPSTNYGYKQNDMKWSPICFGVQTFMCLIETSNITIRIFQVMTRFPYFSQWQIVCFFCYLIYTQPFAKCTAKCKKYFWRAGFHIYWSLSTWDNHVKLQTNWFKHLENYTKETKKIYMVSIVSFLFMFLWHS